MKPVDMIATSPLRRGAARIAGLACVTGAALLASCASGIGVAYHGLEPIAPGAAAVAYDGPVVQLVSVQLPAGIDRDELVQELAPGRFQVLDGDHWLAPLGRLARQTLAADLAARLPPGRSVFPGALWPAAGAQLSVAVLSFSVRDGQAEMRVSWSLRATNSPAGTASEALRGAQLALQTPSGSSPAAIARAWSALLAQLADRITAELAASRAGA
jgi:uncharacterized protein